MNLQRIRIMKLRSYPIISKLAVLSAWALAAASMARAADPAASLVDDFSDGARSSRGIDRVFITDSATGGQSTVVSAVQDGVLRVEGEIVPPRGQPGWASMALLLTADGKPVDLSQYEGVKLRARVGKGLLSVSANSAQIDNFDYHAMTVSNAANEMREIRIPFKDMKRAWSEQTPLDPATIASISIVAVGFQKGAFSYEIDELGFY